MGTPFGDIITDLQSVVRVAPLPAARSDHDEAPRIGNGIEHDVLEIDLAPLLGLECAPHRLLRLADLNAVELFRMAESNEKLRRVKKLEGWPDSLCYDMGLLCAMHRAPQHEGSNKALLDLYSLFVLRPCLRPLWLYLLERVGRAYQSLVRPELALEIYYSDLRLEALLAGAEPPDPPSTQEQEETLEELGLMPTTERHPNASAP